MVSALLDHIQPIEQQLNLSGRRHDAQWSTQRYSIKFGSLCTHHPHTYLRSLTLSLPTQARYQLHSDQENHLGLLHWRCRHGLGCCNPSLHVRGRLAVDLYRANIPLAINTANVARMPPATTTMEKPHARPSRSTCGPKLAPMSSSPSPRSSPQSRPSSMPSPKHRATCVRS